MPLLLDRRQLLLAASAWPLSGLDQATPADRVEYLRRMLRELCTELGPRPSGSKAHEKGASIIERELRKSLPNVSRNKLTFRRWVLVGEPLLMVGGRRVESYWPTIARKRPASVSAACSGERPAARSK